MLVKVTPQDMARAFCQEESNLKYLIYVENIAAFAYYSESQGYYKVYGDKEFERLVYLYMIEHYRQAITTNLIKDVITQISWIIANRIEDVITSTYIALDDKLLNFETFEYEPFSASRPVFYKTYCRSDKVIWDENSRFNQFINEVLVHADGTPDDTLIAMVQEMFGYCLLNTLEGHVTFFLVGDGNNGKSVLLGLLRHLIGKDYSVSESIESITTNRFAPASLIGKKINICVEEESAYIKSDKFKALVSGDEISVEFKYGKRIQWAPTVKHIFATNELPTFNGFNEGLLRRMKIIPFKKQVSADKRDTRLVDKLKEEMGCIMAWAIQGARRLIKNKFYFTEPGASSASLKEFTGNLSSAVLYLWETFEEDENGRIFDDDFYEMYKVWADKRGKKKQSHYSVQKDLNKVLKLKKGIAVRDSNEPPQEYRKLSIKRMSSQEQIPL
jgi:P4 family phage/plasmid primase-like protien